MSVDFTKDSKKTNAQYLRELIEDRPEAIEWFDAMLQELSIAQEGIGQMKERFEEAVDDNDILILRIKDLNETLSEYKTGEGLANQIDTLMGAKQFLFWHCDNLAIQGLMEVFCQKLQKHGHIKLESYLNCLT